MNGLQVIIFILSNKNNNYIEKILESKGYDLFFKTMMSVADKQEVQKRYKCNKITLSTYSSNVKDYILINKILLNTYGNSRMKYMNVDKCITLRDKIQEHIDSVDSSSNIFLEI